jgi:hypothetical protein
MKTLTTSLGVVVVLGLMTLAPNVVFGQETTTTVTSQGTVTELSPDAMSVQVTSAPAPIHYTFTKTTTYVDENGNPVSVETIKSGFPVTVYYDNEDGNMVANKVVVNRTVTTTAPAPPPQPTASTTTTTTMAPSTPMPPQANGIVTDAGEGHIDLRTADSDRPIHYKAHDSTAYVDQNGNPVPRKILTPGTPATVFYEQDGDDMVATRVVIKSPSGF